MYFKFSSYSLFNNDNLLLLIKAANLLKSFDAFILLFAPRDPFLSLIHI